MTSTVTKYLFLDVEWADAEAADLVSLALITDDGQHCFYAERKPLPESPTEFVKAVVYPCLDRGVSALDDFHFCRELRAFLGPFAEAFVLFDHEHDGNLMEHALSGFSLSAAEKNACGPYVMPNRTLMLREGDFSTFFETWFVAHPQARRHHALVDANALRMAFLRTTGRIDATAWVS